MKKCFRVQPKNKLKMIHSIQLKKSNQYFVMISIEIITTFIVIALLPCPFAIKIILMVIVLIYIGYFFDQSLVAFSIDKSLWHLYQKDQVQSAVLCGSSVLTNYFCILRFVIPGSYFRRSYLVFPDSFINKDDYRKFILLCRHA